VLDVAPRGSLVVAGAVAGLVIAAVVAAKRSRQVARVAAAAKGTTLFAIGCAMAAMALKVVCLWLIARAVSSADVAGVFSVAPVGFLVEAIPIAPGGMGTAHLAFEYLFGLRGIGGGAALFNVYFVVRLLVSLVGGLIWAVRRMGSLDDDLHTPVAGPGHEGRVAPAVDLRPRARWAPRRGEFQPAD
jgi:uncharacterized membrane protein YbhN (UPF0104 family)